MQTDLTKDAYLFKSMIKASWFTSSKI